MIELGENARRAIANARALLDAMQLGGWKQICVTGDEGDYFIAREVGIANPLPEPAQTPTVPAYDCVSLTVNAPHIGTVSWLAAVGQTVAQSEIIARLAVLDQEIEVHASEAGQVVEHAGPD